MPVIQVGDRTVLEAGSILLIDPKQIATVMITNLKFEFLAAANAVPPSANFLVPDPNTGRFLFVGMLPGRPYVFNFKSVGYHSDRPFDLDVCVECVVYDHINTPTFRVEYLFAYQPIGPTQPPLPRPPHAYLGDD